MKTFRRISAITIAGALGLAGIFTGISAASAVSISDETPRALTVHKFEQPETIGTVGDGSEIDTTGWNALRGVEFQIQKVDTYNGASVDLTTNAGWNAVPSTTSFDASLAGFGHTETGTTGADGAVKFGSSTDLADSIPMGLYWVTEINHGDNKILESIQPFLVTVPMPNSDGSWNYDVHAYPKNAIATGEKTADNSAVAVGDEITWTISSNIPRLPVGQKFNVFTYEDILIDELSFVSSSLSVRDSAGTAVSVAEGTDYEITHDQNRVFLEFTEQGLLALEAAQGGTVRFNIITELVSIGDGSITNDATITINEAILTGDDGIEETIDFGALQINKVVKDESTPLAGASFQIFRNQADAEARTNPVSIKVSGVPTNTFVSDENGIAFIPGIKAGNYYIIETQAPAGYVGQDNAIGVSIAKSSVAAPNTITIENAQRTGLNLPITGGTGLTLALIIGGGLVVAGISTSVIRRTKKS